MRGHELSDDRAVIQIDPGRSATIQTLGELERNPSLDIDAAFAEVLRQNARLRVACHKYGVDASDVESRIVLMRTQAAASQLRRVERALSLARRGPVHGPAFEIQVEEPRRRLTREHVEEDQMVEEIQHETASDELLALAKAERIENPQLTDDQAMVIVCRRHRELYDRHCDQVNLAKRGGTLADGDLDRGPADRSAAESALGLKPVTSPSQPRKITIQPRKKVSSAGPTVSAALQIINDTADEIQKSTGCSRMAAINAALDRHPDMYDEYNRAMKRQIAGLVDDSQD